MFLVGSSMRWFSQTLLLVAFSSTLFVVTGCRKPPKPDAKVEEFIDQLTREHDFLESLDEVIELGPSESRWAVILTRMETWPHAPLSDAALRHIDRALKKAGWEDEHRKVPARWRALDDPVQREELWQVARHLDVQQDVFSLEKLDHTRHLEHITFLSLDGPASMAAFVDALQNNHLPNHAHLRASNVKLEALSPLFSAPLKTARDQIETLILWDNQIGPPLAKKLVAAGGWPNLKRLDLGSNNLRGEGLAAIAVLAAPKLETLQLDWNAIAPADVTSLIEGSKRWPRLKRLMLSHNTLDSASIASLMQDASLTHLEVLTLANNPLDDAAVAAIAASPQMAGLKKLVLARVGITKVGCTHFEQATFAGLEHLDIGHNATGPDCANSLAKSPFMPKLAALIAPENQWNNEAISHLTRAGFFPTIHVLNLANNNLTGKDCERIAAHPVWGNLTALSLQKNPVGDACAEALAVMPAKLERLLLAHSEMTDFGVLALAKSEKMKELTKLDVGWNALTHVSAEAITLASFARQLEVLSLEGNTVGDEGLTALLKERKLPALWSLELGWTGLQDDSTKVIAEASWLSQLGWLDLQGNGFTRVGVERVQQAEHLSAPIRKEFTSRYLHVFQNSGEE